MISSTSSGAEETLLLVTLQSTSMQPWLITVEIGKQPSAMEINIRASILLVSDATYVCTLVAFEEV